MFGRARAEAGRPRECNEERGRGRPTFFGADEAGPEGAVPAPMVLRASLEVGKGMGGAPGWPGCPGHWPTLPKATYPVLADAEARRARFSTGIFCRGHGRRCWGGNTRVVGGWRAAHGVDARG